MRIKKAAKNKKSVVTLKSAEILDACILYLEQKGYQQDLGCLSTIVFKHDKKDKLGRIRRGNLEIQFEVANG